MMRNLFLLFALMPLMANADIQPNAQGNWFIEGRYQASVYEGAGWNSAEHDTPGTESSQLLSTNTNSRDKLNSTGVSIGRTFNASRTALGFTYENFGSSVWKSGQYTAKDGRTFCLN